MRRATQVDCTARIAILRSAKAFALRLEAVRSRAVSCSSGLVAWGVVLRLEAILQEWRRAPTRSGPVARGVVLQRAGRVGRRAPTRSDLAGVAARSDLKR